MKKLEMKQMEIISGGETAPCPKGGQAVMHVLGAIACGVAFASFFAALIAGPSCAGLVAGQVVCILKS